jgi:hypothetical protein
LPNWKTLKGGRSSANADFNISPKSRLPQTLCPSNAEWTRNQYRLTLPIVPSMAVMLAVAIGSVFAHFRDAGALHRG